MREYMKLTNGRGLVRADCDTMTFESYHGNGVWANDNNGLADWSGRSSAWSHYVEISGVEAKEVMQTVDDHIRSKIAAARGAEPPGRVRHLLFFSTRVFSNISIFYSDIQENKGRLR